jgi:hypothetical protein
MDEETYKQINTIWSLRRWNLVTCDNMDGTGDYYAKWNKPGTERQLPCYLTHMWNLKIVDLIEVKRMVGTRAQRE